MTQLAPASNSQPEQHPITDYHRQKAARIMDKAKCAIVLDDPFYAAILLKMNIVEDLTISTMCTNGVYVKYNPKFVCDISTEENFSKVKGVIRHEVFHVASLHVARMQNRDHRKWNYATDCVTNEIGKEAGWDLPADGVFMDGAKDMSAEHVYSILPDNPNGPGGEGNDSWNWGGIEPHPDITDAASQRQVEIDTITDVINAAKEAKIRGKLPSHVERLVETLTDAKLPWKEIVAKFFKSLAKNDYNWNYPSRRAQSLGLYLPALHSYQCGPIVLAIDTSGSIGQSELIEFISELNGLIKQGRPEKTYVLYCDAAVQRVEEYKPDDDVRVTKPKGGGGTAFEPVFDWVAENRIQPECLIYLTDMYGSFPEQEPSYPTIWVSTTNVKNAPFGKVVHL